MSQYIETAKQYISEGSEESPSLDNGVVDTVDDDTSSTDTDATSGGFGIGITSGFEPVEEVSEDDSVEVVETGEQVEETENNETSEILESTNNGLGDGETSTEEKIEGSEIRDMTEEAPKEPAMSLDNLDISKMANPFAKPENNDVEAKEEVVETETDSSNISSSIEEPKLNIPSFNIGSMLNSTSETTPQGVPQEEKTLEETMVSPLPPPLPPMPQGEIQPAATVAPVPPVPPPPPIPATTETNLPPATLPIGINNTAGDKEKFYEDLEKLVESYKGKGFIGDYKKFDFGNFSTITITLNNLK